MKIRSLLTPFALIAWILASGTTGFMLIEKLAFIDALYMTVITATTVGFGELDHSFSIGGRLFTIGLIATSVTFGAYGISLIFGYIVEGHLGTEIRRRWMEKRIKSLDGHYIVCGIGMTGAQIIQELKRHGVTFVAIDRDEALVRQYLLDNPRDYCIAGDCTQEADLDAAGIRRAGVITYELSTETDNIVGVLTARSMNSKMVIVARGTNQEGVGKLNRAGANHVILPEEIAGARMARFALNPSVVDFLDVVTRDADMQLILDDLFIGAESPLKGKPLRESKIREKSNAMVVAIRRDMDYTINPPVDMILKDGDILLVLGNRDQLSSLFDYAGGNMGWGVG